MLRSPWALTVATLLLLAPGCGEPAAPSAAEAAAGTEAPPPLTIDAERAGLYYRYVDPESGAVATATTATDVPAGARNQVIVFDDAAPTPAGWEQVADLGQGLPVTTTPTRGFVLSPRVLPTSGGPGAASPPPTVQRKRRAGGQHEVVMFSTRGCGYCKKARSFFDSQRVPYTEYDVERDPKAGARLAELGKAAGVAQSQLRGVPILFIDGEPILGWDKSAVKRLLGI